MGTYVTPSHSRVLRVVLAGDSGVGKTSLADRLGRGEVRRKEESVVSRPTVEVDFRTRTIARQDSTLQLLLLDVPGRVGFLNVCRQFFRSNAHTMVVVYDVADIKSFENVERWVREYDAKGNLRRSFVM